MKVVAARVVREKQKELSRPVALDTLAAAYAEAGRLGEASPTAQWAHAAALAQGLEDMAGQIRQRLALYDSQQPYRRDRGAQR